MVLKNPNKYQIGKTIVYFIRHGDRIHIEGQKDIGLKIPGPGLNEKGKKQAKEIAKKLSKIKNDIDAFYCSSMARAIETAEEISKKIKKKPIIVNELSEFNKFLWQRKFYHPKFWKHYSLHRKSLIAFNKILKQNNGKVVVIVAHGNVIKGLLFTKLGLSLKQAGVFSHYNCNTSIARFKGTKLDHIYCWNSSGLEVD